MLLPVLLGWIDQQHTVLGCLWSENFSDPKGLGALQSSLPDERDESGARSPNATDGAAGIRGGGTMGNLDMTLLRTGHDRGKRHVRTK